MEAAKPKGLHLRRRGKDFVFGDLADIGVCAACYALPPCRP